MKVVLDTNVVVSALLSPSGPPGRILDLATAREIDVLYDDRIIAEYEDVLARPRLAIDPADASAIVTFFLKHGYLTPSAPIAVELPDPDDLPFAEVAEGGFADALVTGNSRHFVPIRGTLGTPVLTPAEFLNHWGTRQFPPR